MMRQLIPKLHNKIISLFAAQKMELNEYLPLFLDPNERKNMDE